MAKQDFFSRQQNKGTFSWGTIRQQPQKSKSSHTGLWLTIFLLIILVILAVVYKNDIFNQPIEPVVNESIYEIGTDIEVEWKLASDWDILNYTHSLTTTDWEIYLLKSKTISLNNISNLSWTYAIEWTIESLLNWKPLVEVSLVTNKTQESNQWWDATPVEDNTPQWIYVSEAGVGLTAEFFDNYALVDEQNKWNITVKNLDNNETTTISYFTCTDAWDTNCKQLTKTFESNAVKKITTINWDTFYKLPDVQSWYFQNNNRRGYFINNASDAEVEKLKDFIIIPNDEIIKNIVTRYGIKTCFWEDKALNTIKSHTVEKIGNDILITMQWEWEKLFTCQAVLNLGLATKLDFVDIKVEEKSETEEAKEEVKEEQKQEEVKEEKKEEATNENKETAKETVSVETPATKQFAINPSKPMTYESRWEYSMIFPSSNISFSADSSSEDFNQVGVRCSKAVKVIQYKNKEQLQESPATVVYDCTAKNWIELPWKNYILKELGNKKFVIQINDPAWYDFAKNITIEAL